MQNRFDDEPQGNNSNINGSIFFNHQRQDCGSRSDSRILSVDAIEQPQEQRREEAVFVNIIAGATGVCWAKEEHSTDQCLLRSG